MKQLGQLLIALVLAITLSTVVFASKKNVTTVLFTHDLHSHFLPVATKDGGESGGYARLTVCCVQAC